MSRLHDVSMIVFGGLGVLAAQAAFLLVRRALGMLSATQRAEALRADADRRARDAEDRLRLAELEVARVGGRIPEDEKRVRVRPI